MPTAALDQVRIFGIRHHGPGSARSLVQALDEWQPDLLLVEGPVEAEPLLPLLSEPDVELPVAMLLYAVDRLDWAHFYPLAEFSPELQAFRWAHARATPVRLFDLPAAYGLALRTHRESASPLPLAAKSAGFEEVEDWWNQLVEQRSDARGVFEGLETLMAALRDLPTLEREAEDPGSDEDERTLVPEAEFEEMREAHMRLVLRDAMSTGAERIAVVCGAWHAPAFRQMPAASQDRATLKGLPKVKVAATLTPWTYERLTQASGYGAGAQSPAFYDLLWRHPAAEIPTQWLLKVAHLLRSEDIDASPASVIEAQRLAVALAALRDRPRPGLNELRDAANSVMVTDPLLWDLIGRRLIVGEVMGKVPDATPHTPIAADLNRLIKSLRLKKDDGFRTMTLDLRQEFDRERSRLFRRLNLLAIPWAKLETVSGSKGTFHEPWELRWQPELDLKLIDVSIYGSTIEEAANQRAIQDSIQATKIAQMSELVSEALFADLTKALPIVLERLNSVSVSTADVLDLAGAILPLVDAYRYGTVHKLDQDQLRPLIDTILIRLCIGLPPACAGLDDDGAALMVRTLDQITSVIQILESPEHAERWAAALAQMADLRGAHPQIWGKAERLRYDLNLVSAERLAVRLRQEVSVGVAPLAMAQFIEGLLDGSGAVLLHQQDLFAAIDEWLGELLPQTFDEVLPLVRRTFSLFSRAERRQIGERLVGKFSAQTQGSSDLDEARAEQVLPIVFKILGVQHD